MFRYEGANVMEERNWIQGLETIDARLATDLESCWRDQEAIFHRQWECFGSLTFTRDGCGSLAGFVELRQELANTLLAAPLAEWRQKEPLRRVTNAIERYRSDALEVIQTLPEQNRSIVTPEFWSRFKILLRQSRLFRSAAHQLIRPYEIAMYTLCHTAIGHVSTAYLEAEQAPAASAAKRLSRLISDGIADWRNSWIQHKGHLLTGREWLFPQWPLWTAAASNRALALWHEDLEATIALAECQDHVERQIASLVVEASEQLRAEEDAVLGEMEKAIVQLKQLLRDDMRGELPVPKVQIMPASTRMLEIDNAVELTLGEVPESCGLPWTFVLFGRSVRMRLTLGLRRKLHQSFRRNARPEFVLALEQFEAQQRKVAAEMERACEVVAFALETTKSQPGRDGRVRREANRNALALLEFTRAHTIRAISSACAGVAQALAASFLDNRLFVDVRRMEISARLAQKILQKKVVSWARKSIHFTKWIAKESLNTSTWSLEWLQVYIGWRPPSPGVKGEVITRPALPPEFRTNPNSKDLPSIYRRLFASEPLENARFLVGRETEMAALAQARGFWDSGRPATVVIIGEIGSGKTTLINCALTEWAADLPVVRGQFDCRLTEAAQLRTYLGTLLGCDPDELERFLLNQRRVIVLEEVEKTFLRQVGHLSAIRALQGLIAASSSSTLWILAINQIAFRLLDSTVQFRHTFSHQINAGTAQLDELRKAVMLRHNLSGLRLEFLPGTSTGIWSKLPKCLQKKSDAEARFFSALSQQSDGVFRTAFNIWLAHVETVESGTMYMKPITMPDLAGIIGSLKSSDLFTLLAVLEHGVLTPAEHASIFQKGLATSQSQIDELVSREVLEYEVNRVACRIRPQAMRVVNEALSGRNLI